MLSRSRLLARAVSQSIFSPLVVADANDLNHQISDDQLELDLRNKIDGIFPSAVELGVSLLSAMAASLKYGHAFDANLVQRILYAFQLRHLDDGFDFGHRDSYNPTPKSPKLESSLLVLVLLQYRRLELHRTRRRPYRLVLQTSRCPSGRNDIFRICGNTMFMQI